MGSGQMAPWLRALTALRGLAFGPQHSDTCKSSSRVSNTLIQSLRAPIYLIFVHRSTYTRAHTHFKKYNNNLKFKKYSK